MRTLPFVYRFVLYLFFFFSFSTLVLSLTISLFRCFLLLRKNSLFPYILTFSPISNNVTCCFALVKSQWPTNIVLIMVSDLWMLMIATSTLLSFHCYNFCVCVAFVCGFTFPHFHDICLYLLGFCAVQFVSIWFVSRCACCSWQQVCESVDRNNWCSICVNTHTCCCCYIQIAIMQNCSCRMIHSSR